MNVLKKYSKNNMTKVKIRYNTNAKSDEDLHWRVLINGVEHLASNVVINCLSYTTKDIIEGVGEKWHISCEPKQVQWMDKECILI
jgi:hypothetical protein